MRRRWLLTLPVLVGIAGCSARGLSFRQDDRVDVVAPEDRSEVSLPLTVRWTTEGLAPDTRFGVAVDTTPPRPGEAPDDDDLVVTTTDTEVTLEQLGSSSRAGDRGVHRITVFLLDEDGRRVGESSWRVDVELEGP